jgi:gliding motility-associated-like protein
LVPPNRNRAKRRIVSNVVKVQVYATPQINAGQNRVVVRGTTITINATSSNTNNSYKWRPNIFLNYDTLLTPTANLLLTTQYILQATSTQGCITTDTTLITAVNSLFIPNAFTPNFDGINDVWRITNLDAETQTTLYIYNRQGQQIHYYKGNAPSWNGLFKQTPVAAGNYVYYLTFNNGLPPIKGNLLVLQ